MICSYPGDKTKPAIPIPFCEETNVRTDGKSVNFSFDNGDVVFEETVIKNIIEIII